MHGDLGCVTAADVVVCISHSGNTQELVHAMGHIQTRDPQPTILSIVRRPSLGYLERPCVGGRESPPSLRFVKMPSCTVGSIARASGWMHHVCMTMCARGWRIVSYGCCRLAPRMKQGRPVTRSLQL